eukprot:16443746-Heterocapsa_arctica.AAC.1
MGKAYRQGIKTVTDPNGDSYFEKNGKRVPLHLRNNSFYFRAKRVGNIDEKKHQAVRAIERVTELVEPVPVRTALTQQ